MGWGRRLGLRKDGRRGDEEGWEEGGMRKDVRGNEDKKNGREWGEGG